MNRCKEQHFQLNCEKLDMLLNCWWSNTQMMMFLLLCYRVDFIKAISAHGKSSNNNFTTNDNKVTQIEITIHGKSNNQSSWFSFEQYSSFAPWSIDSAYTISNAKAWESFANQITRNYNEVLILTLFQSVYLINNYRMLFDLNKTLKYIRWRRTIFDWNQRNI